MNKKLCCILLREFKKRNLKTLWEWSIPENLPIIIPTKKSSFHKSIYLKENLYKIITEKNFLDISYWIVNKWGGISSLKKNEVNDNKIWKFKKRISGSKISLTKNEFKTISSLSKIASFYKPKEFFIYDSRAIYSLNWIIFKNNIDTNFFPQPSGRNSSIIEYDQKTIFNLSKRKVEYYDENVAYFKYCELLKETAALSTKIKPYEIEMFLFSIAVSDVIEDIKKSLTISMR